MTVGFPEPIALGVLSDDEERILDQLLARLDHFSARNILKESYYEARQRVRHMGIAIPPEVASRIDPVVGWAGTVVDIMDERLDWNGWIELDERYGLDEVYADNMLDIESGAAQG